MSEVSVSGKEPDYLDELMILDLNIPYARFYHTENGTQIDIHIKKDEAVALYNALKEKLENQVVSPSVDR